MNPALTVPALFCPFPSRINEHAADADSHTLDWLVDHDLLSRDGYEQFGGYRCGWLAARAYPNADLEALTIASDWIGWLCALNNQCDESGVGTRPAQLTRELARFGELLQSPRARTGDHDGPLETSLADLLRRMSRRSTPTWMTRFGRDVDAYFDALVWEATNRAQSRTPSLAEYLDMRPRTSAMDHCVDLIELAEGVEVPSDLRASTGIQGLTAKAINAVCWANDLFSLQRELESGSRHNLVIVLQHERGCSLQAALDTVVELHDAEIRSFIDLQAQVTADRPLEQSTQVYLLGLRSWMRGNLEWSADTARYRR
jgi:5-epi-alpha-selinene synthase